MDDATQSPPPAPEKNLQSQPPAALEPSLTPSPPRLSDHPMHVVFIGPEGLRVGWRLVLYLLFGFSFVLLIGGLVGRIQELPFVWEIFLNKVVWVLAVMLAAAVMARLERRRFGDYGLPRHEIFGKNFWVGAIWGIGGITCLLLTLRISHAFYFGPLALHGARILKFGAFWGAFFLLVALFEEFLFRGYTQFTLTQGIGFWPSAGLLSVSFGAIHLGNQGEVWVGVLAAGVIGFFLAFTLRRTGSLWFALGFHAFWDWGESYLYSTPDSGLILPGHLLRSSFHGPRWLTGGSVGPEGSVLLFVIIGLTWVAFDRVYPDARYGVPNQREITIAD